MQCLLKLHLIKYDLKTNIGQRIHIHRGFSARMLLKIHQFLVNSACTEIDKKEYTVLWINTEKKKYAEIGISFQNRAYSQGENNDF